MRKVYAREEGIAIRIGNHGTATYDRPALVPEAVADELATNARVRVEGDESALVPAPDPEESTAPEAEKE